MNGSGSNAEPPHTPIRHWLSITCYEAGIMRRTILDTTSGVQRGGLAYNATLSYAGCASSVVISFVLSQFFIHQKVTFELLAHIDEPSILDAFSASYDHPSYFSQMTHYVDWCCESMGIFWHDTIPIDAIYAAIMVSILVIAVCLLYSCLREPLHEARSKTHHPQPQVYQTNYESNTSVQNIVTNDRPYTQQSTNIMPFSMFLKNKTE